MFDEALLSVSLIILMCTLFGRKVLAYVIKQYKNEKVIMNYFVVPKCMCVHTFVCVHLCVYVCVSYNEGRISLDIYRE